MKVHVRIDNDRSLCGMSPRHGLYDIRTLITFFQSREKDQCSRCVHHLQQRGYSINKLRSSVVQSSRVVVLTDRMVGVVHA